MTREAAVATALAEDGRARVTRFEFAPGAETGWHIHEMDYVIVALSLCQMRLEEPGGVMRDVVIEAGQAYTRQSGVEHNVINNGDTAMAFVEVELK